MVYMYAGDSKSLIAKIGIKNVGTFCDLQYHDLGIYDIRNVSIFRFFALVARLAYRKE